MTGGRGAVARWVAYRHPAGGLRVRERCRRRATRQGTGWNRSACVPRFVPGAVRSPVPHRQPHFASRHPTRRRFSPSPPRVSTSSSGTSTRRSCPTPSASSPRWRGPVGCRRGRPRSGGGGSLRWGYSAGTTRPGSKGRGRSVVTARSPSRDSVPCYRAGNPRQPRIRQPNGTLAMVRTSAGRAHHNPAAFMNLPPTPPGGARFWKRGRPFRAEIRPTPALAERTRACYLNASRGATAREVLAPVASAPCAPSTRGPRRAAAIAARKFRRPCTRALQKGIRRRRTS